MFVFFVCETLLVPAYYWAAALADGVRALLRPAAADPRTD